MPAFVYHCSSGNIIDSGVHKAWHGDETVQKPETVILQVLSHT